jgi:hypothetical protein
MNPQEKATELKDKFGDKALEFLEETFIVWNIKRDCEIERIHAGDTSEKVLRGLNICNRTLNYWNKVKDILEE